MKKPIVLVILGQTATGKSTLAVNIAKKIGGEIISADSRQVYRGLNIGTGKISKKDMQGIPHYLLDIVSPKKKFTVIDFQRRATLAMADIVRRGKVPIICGGTGFYIDAITKGIAFPEVPPDSILRKQLASKSATALHSVLEKLDSNRARNIDPKNKVRLIRAIEIARALGKVPSIIIRTSPYKFVKVGFYLPPDELKIRVEKRVERMFDDGLLNEVKKLRRSGVSSKRLKELGFEYNEPTYEKVVSQTLKYAARQMTWFKRDKEIKWFNASKSAINIVNYSSHF